MDLLTTNKKVFTWLCAYPTNGNASKQKIIQYVAFTMTMLIGLICAFSSCVLYFTRYLSTDLTESLYAVYQMNVFFSAIYVIIYSIISRRKIYAMVNNLSSIYDESKFQAHQSKSLIVFHRAKTITKSVELI